jgi:hypothetical protein
MATTLAAAGSGPSSGRRRLGQIFSQDDEASMGRIPLPTTATKIHVRNIEKLTGQTFMP